MGRLKTSLCAVVVAVMAMPPAHAAGDKGVPTIDLQVRCKKSEAAVLDLMGDPSLKGTAFQFCMKSEQDARAALEAAWKDVPPSYKSFCIRTGDYSASYVEWIACLEMMIDAKQQRAATGAKLGDVTGRCPTIHYADDGSIKSIVACPPTGRR